jgi:hypothetical protein
VRLGRQLAEAATRYAVELEKHAAKDSTTAAEGADEPAGRAA